MSSDEKQTTDSSLIARIKDGSEEAAGVLYYRYASRLRSLAMAKTGADLAGRVDADDIVQSAFASFFRGAKDGQYNAPSGEEIWNLLLVMTLNKVRAKAAYHRADKRDVRKTVDDLEGKFEVPDSDQAAATMLKMVIEEVLDKLPPTSADVIKCRLEGYEVADIAARLGRAKRSVERILQDFRSRMAEILGYDQRKG
jgi:RNA polymerase sigma-70 factor, ECF subfamily